MLYAVEGRVVKSFKLLSVALCSVFVNVFVYVMPVVHLLSIAAGDRNSGGVIWQEGADGRPAALALVVPKVF